MEEATHDTSSRKRKSSGLIDTYFAQCGKCYQWRSIESQEAYEKIRSEALNKSFECKNNCREPGDADVEGDSTRVWCEDHLHGLPQTPQGFKRILVLRESCHRADVYYLTPQGKRLRSCREVAGFIQDNEGFADTHIEDISFAAPKVMNKKKDVAAPTNRPALVLKRCETLLKKKPNKKSSKSSLVINSDDRPATDKEDEPLGDVELSHIQKGCETLMKKKRNKKRSKIAVAINSDEREGKVMPESVQNERPTTEKGDVELSHIQKGSETLSKKKRNKKKSKIAVAINSEDGEGKVMPESLQNERSTTEKDDEPLGDVELSHIQKGSETLSKKKRNKKRSKIAVAINSDERPATDKNIEKETCTKKSLKSEISSSNEVIIEELEKAKCDGKVAANGKKVSILYTGKLKDTGKLFDSNMGETPFRFRLGRGKVIEGLSIGIEGMRVGEKRRLTIPPSLGYSEEGFKDVVPNNAWLVYEVEAVKVR